MNIRPADESDLDLVCRMRLEFLADHRGIPAESFPQDLVAQTRAFVDRRVRLGTMHSWLAEHHGACTGIVSMLLMEVPPRPGELRTSEGYIINMYVVPGRRHKGIGRALLDACRTGAVGLGVRQLNLHATDSGREMYERAGFERSARWMELPL